MPLPPQVRLEAERLLAGFPTRQELTDAVKLLAHSKDAKADDIKQARERISIAEDRLPKLRALITKGTSIFDYPGLLAAGNILYIESRGDNPGTSGHIYRMFLGTSEGYDEFQRPNMAIIDFDQTGVILSVARPGNLAL